MRAKNFEIVKKIGTENLENGGPNLHKSSPEGAKMGPGVDWDPMQRLLLLLNRKQDRPPQKTIRLRKSCQDGSELAPKIEAASKKNRC